jgi:hypothetical protein
VEDVNVIYLRRLSGDSDFLPAVQMVGNYGMEVAIFRQVGDHDSGKNGSDPKIQSHVIAEEDLKRSMLPDRIPLGDGTAITWSEYMELKIASEMVSSEHDRACLAE